MSGPEGLFDSRNWPRLAAIALIAIGTAGCSDSGRRFEFSNPFASNKSAAPPQQDVTGSVATQPASTGRIESQALPAPSQPQTVAANGGVAQGAQGLGAYRPGTADITGSVPARREPPAPTGHWNWEGGTPITVGAGETAEIIGRKYGVPTAAILQANGVSNPSEIRPGQRLVIPRYVVASPAPPPPAPVVAPVAARAPAPAKPAELVHVVAPGESLIGIARRYGVALKTLAQANKIEPYAKVNMGDRLTVPGHQQSPANQAKAPRIEPPRTMPAQKLASAPAQNARMASPETPAPESVTKSAEAAGAMPSFRWPVRGRVITAFGAKSNGQQNDGINLAVPEGTPVKAADDGVVAYAGNELKGYGNLVLVRHSNGFVSAYAHASEILVKRGDTIKRGQTIARAGQTGNVTSPQLHFEIRKGSTPVDPAQYLGNPNG